MMHRQKTAALVLLILVTGVTFAAPAAADSSSGDGLLSGVLDAVDDEDGDGFSIDDAAARWKDSTAAGFDSFKWRLAQKNPFAEPETTAAEEMQAVQAYFNRHNGTLQEDLNRDVNASNYGTTAEVTLTIDGETETRYITASKTADGSNYTGLQMRETLPEERSVDEETHICGYAAVNAEEELKHFTEEYAATGEDPSQSYGAKMQGAYEKDVESTLIDTRGSCDGGE